MATQDARCRRCSPACCAAAPRRRHIPSRCSANRWFPADIEKYGKLSGEVGAGRSPLAATEARRECRQIPTDWRAWSRRKLHDKKINHTGVACCLRGMREYPCMPSCLLVECRSTQLIMLHQLTKPETKPFVRKMAAYDSGVGVRLAEARVNVHCRQLACPWAVYQGVAKSAHSWSFSLCNSCKGSSHVKCNVRT